MVKLPNTLEEISIEFFREALKEYEWSAHLDSIKIPKGAFLKKLPSC